MHPADSQASGGEVVMEPIDPAVMFVQASNLGHDLRSLTEQVAEQIKGLLSPGVWASVDRVYLCGDGDSHHASRAAQLAFESLAGVDCRALSAQHFLSYGPDLSRRNVGRTALVIGISASGSTELVRQVLAHARECGALTVALTGRRDSPVTQVAEYCLVVELAGSQPSPGIRTYQASLLGLLLIAAQLSDDRTGSQVPAPENLRDEILGLAVAVDATAAEAGLRCPALVETIAAAPIMTVLGSGPSHGTAMFAAAKIIEGAGVFAAGQDLEEWSHVERFARPFDMPVIIIAPPGRTHRRAVQAAEQARSLGRYVVAISDRRDSAVTAHANTVLPVFGVTREAFSPLLYHPFAAHLAGRLAQRLGRHPFQAEHDASC
jgi:glucosamine--fructose-6-phosphate aminotransferase (isomerizing)